MPINNPPLSDNYQDDNWKIQATDIIRELETQINELQIKVIDLESRVSALE